MGYLNPIEVFGYQAFANAAQASGVDGVLVVDTCGNKWNKGFLSLFF
jgi:tryptophan synthase alpha subunit